MATSRLLRGKSVLPQLHSRGFTLIEIVIVSAILGILAIPVSRFVLKTVQAVTSSTGRTLARGQVLPAFHVIETDLRNAVLIDSAPANGQFIEFRMDANRMPGHTCNPPDDDMDDGTILPPPDRWKVGMNIEDDDDDPLPTPDGNIDARSRVYQVGNEVYIAHSWNEGHWIENLLLRGVPPAV